MGRTCSTQEMVWCVSRSDQRSDTDVCKIHRYCTMCVGVPTWGTRKYKTHVVVSNYSKEKNILVGTHFRVPKHLETTVFVVQKISVSEEKEYIYIHIFFFFF